MNVELVLALESRQYLITMQLSAGTTIRQAVVLAFEKGLLPYQESLIDPATAPLGVYGELEDDAYVLNEGDRVEIYRPLLQDPKEWRRQRANLKKNSAQ